MHSLDFDEKNFGRKNGGKVRNFWEKSRCAHLIWIPMQLKVIKDTYAISFPPRLGLFWFSKSFVTTPSKMSDLTSSSLPEIPDSPLRIELFYDRLV